MKRNQFNKEFKAKAAVAAIKGQSTAMDNIMIERLWRSVKYEEIYIKEFPTVEAVIIGLRQYFKFYNHERPHATFGGLTPAEVYNGMSIHRKVA